MIKVRVDYATKSAKYPRFSKELDFNDEKHLQNFLEKANREGRKLLVMKLFLIRVFGMLSMNLKILKMFQLGT